MFVWDLASPLKLVKILRYSFNTLSFPIRDSPCQGNSYQRFLSEIPLGFLNLYYFRHWITLLNLNNFWYLFKRTTEQSFLFTIRKYMFFSIESSTDLSLKILRCNVSLWRAFTLIYSQLSGAKLQYWTHSTK